jgi:hypothetical protein
VPPLSRNRASALLLVVAAFLITRVLFEPVTVGIGSISLSGNLAERITANLSARNFDVASLGNGMPLLDRELLLHDLTRSLWYLHSQPPLFNALVAGILRMPGDFARNYQYFNWLIALALYVGTFGLMQRFGVTPSIAAACVIAFMLLPNALWHERAVYYGLPLAFLLLVAARSWDRAMRSGSVAALAVACVAIVLLPLTRAFFTPLWCAGMLAAGIVVFSRMHPALRAKAIAAAVIPFAFVAAFQLKQFVLFHQMLGSSWFGCNLAAMTASMSGDKTAALAAGKVSPLVEVYRNAPPSDFLRYFNVARTGVPALDELVKTTGQPNFNHIVYVDVGRVYLSDTRYLILHHPLKYLLNVANSAYIFCGYQIGMYFDRPHAFLARYSARQIAAPFLGAFLLLVAASFAIKTFRHASAGDRATLGFLIVNIAYVIGVSWFFEKSEGPVYRFQIEPFLWCFIAFAADAAVQKMSRVFRERSATGLVTAANVRD